MNKNNHTTTDLGYSPDLLAQRRAELLALLSQTAPEVLSDHQQINVDKLKALLGEEHPAGDEHYELSWAGKSAARREIQKTSSHTLLPDANNPAQAPHMLIEGENLEVLRVLQKSYYGKVKMIYIDPPYNTGNDSFVYPDDYSETLEEYQKRTGEKNEAGYLNKQSLWKKNSKESGQYHSAWLSMMYPRLYLARNLLRDDGVIFISIDDNEAANLKLLCDEIFGGENYVSEFIWKSKSGGANDSGSVAVDHEYVFCYSKNIDSLPLGLDPKGVASTSYSQQDEKGKYALERLDKQNLQYSVSLDYEIEGPDGVIYRLNHKNPKQPNAIWRWSKDRVKNEFSSLVFKDGNVYTKNYEKSGLKPRSLLVDDRFGRTRTGSADFGNIVREGGFDNPKPVKLLNFFLGIGSGLDSVVLDFFAGSGTTAQALMELNIEDGGNRQCICVQMPEMLNKDSEAYKAGYRTIADITRARIDKVIAKLKAEHPGKTADLACAHFTLAPSNFKVWRGDVNDAQALRDQLALFQSAEKTGQAPQAVDAQTAMLTELLLKHGLGALGVHAISKPLQVAGVTVHRVLAHDDKPMWLCFEPYTEALKNEIVRAHPAQVVMLNSCFVVQDGHGADEQLSNLQLELAGLDIGLTVI